MNMQLDWFSYKIYKCKRNCLNNYRCKFYHNKLDHRRSVIKYKYYSRICSNKENCKQIEKCIFSHNNFELLFHPNFYKTNYCVNYFVNKSCKYDIYCCNAHNESELKIELIHYLTKDINFFLFKFKTVFCPLKNTRHQKDKCVYSHNYQDYRRIPLYNSINVKCNKWPKNIIPDIYTNHCDYYCRYYHGWKEFGYHFNNYKIIDCKFNFESCKYNLICPKKHEYKDKKFFKESKNLKKLNLIFVPKNQLNNKII